MIRKPLIFALFAFFACTPAEPPRCAPIPTTYEDAGPSGDEVMNAASPCAKACANLRVLGCPEGAKPTGGKACYEVCEEDQRASSKTLRVGCVSSAKTRLDVLSCGVRCEVAK